MLAGDLCIVTACRNRNEHLQEVLPSWINSVSNIVITDWSSSTSVLETVQKVLSERAAVKPTAVKPSSEHLPTECPSATGPASDCRQSATNCNIKIMHVVNASRWILSPAFNLAVMNSDQSRILKLDCDDLLKPEFVRSHELSPGEFRCGEWTKARTEQEKYLNGLTMFHRDDFISVGMYNEYITTYGWDDSDLYARLESKCKKLSIDNDLVEHLPHGDRSDSTNTFVEIQYNRILCKYLHAASAPKSVFSEEFRETFDIGSGRIEYVRGSVQLNAVVPREIHINIADELHDMLGYVRPDLINKLYIHLQNGLGNKMRAMASGYNLYKYLKYRSVNKLNWKLTFVWPLDEHCEAAHDDLFTLDSLTGSDPMVSFTEDADLPSGFVQYYGNRRIPIISVDSDSRAYTLPAGTMPVVNVSSDKVSISETPVGETPYAMPVVNPISVAENFPESIETILASFNPSCVYIETANVIQFPDQSWTSDCDYIKSLVLSEEVNSMLTDAINQLPVSIHDCIGMHIREGQDSKPDSTDSWPENKKQQWAKWRAASKFEKFKELILEKPDEYFYIASDSELVYEQASELKNVVSNRRDLYDRSRLQVLYGLVDVLMLAKTKAFYGSNWSSFSELVARCGSKNNRYAGRDW